MIHHTPQEMIDLITAHTQGKPIQVKFIGTGTWLYDPNPNWNFSQSRYRVKPIIVKYRLALLRWSNTSPAEVCVITASEQGANLESTAILVRWLGPWVEVEV